MKNICLLVIAIILLNGLVQAQKVIELPMPVSSGSVKWTEPERQYAPFPNNPDEIVVNVSKPTLTAYLPKPEAANGTAIVVCPGGAFHILAITTEGTSAAKWLNEKGIAVFVLKYRLVPSNSQSLSELSGLLSSGSPKLTEILAPVIPLSNSDGLTAIGYVREHAKEFNVNPKRVGIMGFSAGGQVAANAALNYTAANRPDFAAPIYAYVGPLKAANVPADAPPLFLAAASNDELNLAVDSVDLYGKWLAAKKTAELHIYSKGGHGFGMSKKNLPSDGWIESFYAFLKQEILK